jgi:hypothetical protein
LHRSADGSVVARRIVTDAADKVYFAYELAIEPSGQADAFLASFRLLEPAGAGLDPARSIMQTPTTIPPQRMIHLGESTAVPLGVALGSGATLTDEIVVGATPLSAEAGMLHLRRPNHH